MGRGSAQVVLPAGGYEIHIMADNCQTIIKNFLVDETNHTTIPLAFNPAPAADTATQNQIQYVTIGPSMADLLAQIASLQTQVAELKKKVNP